jgi:hypothetical protein
LLVAVALLLGYQTFSRSKDWGGAISFALAESEHHPQSGRAATLAALNLTRAIMRQPALREAYYERAFALAQRSVKMLDDSISAHLTLILLTGTNRQPLPDWLLPDLEKRLRTGVPHKSYVSHLNKVSVWERSRLVAHLPPGEIPKLYALLLENPLASAELKGMIFRGLAAYYVKNTHELDRAGEMMTHARAVEPGNVMNPIYQAHVALQQKNPAQAAEFVDQAEKIDARNTHHSDIVALRWRIANFRRSPGGAVEAPMPAEAARKGARDLEPGD